jgi:hypothetical protein
MFLRYGQTWGRAALLLTAAATTVAASERPAWPPFAPARDELPPSVVEKIDRVWSHPTLRRSVHGRPAPVPFGVYALFIDTPDLTAAAARHLNLAKWDVRTVQPDVYEADDHEGAHGAYRVLVHERHRRVILSWGEHRGSILGTIAGSSLSVIDLTEASDGVEPRLTAYVLIENRTAAILAKSLIAVFGWAADDKLMRGFKVTAKVAEWAVAQPGEFCPWLAREPLSPESREQALAAVSTCSIGAVTRPAG